MWSAVVCDTGSGVGGPRRCRGESGESRDVCVVAERVDPPPRPMTGIRCPTGLGSREIVWGEEICLGGGEPKLTETLCAAKLPTRSTSPPSLMSHRCGLARTGTTTSTNSPTSHRLTTHPTLSTRWATSRATASRSQGDDRLRPVWPPDWLSPTPALHPESPPTAPTAPTPLSPPDCPRSPTPAS